HANTLQLSAAASKSSVSTDRRVSLRTRLLGRLRGDGSGRRREREPSGGEQPANAQQDRESAHPRGDLRVMLEQAPTREEIVPVVRVALLPRLASDEHELTRTRIRAIDRD